MLNSTVVIVISVSMADKEYDTVRLYDEDATWLYEQKKRGETMADAFKKIREKVEAPR